MICDNCEKVEKEIFSLKTFISGWFDQFLRRFDDQDKKLSALMEALNGVVLENDGKTEKILDATFLTNGNDDEKIHFNAETDGEEQNFADEVGDDDDDVKIVDEEEAKNLVSSFSEQLLVSNSLPPSNCPNVYEKISNHNNLTTGENRGNNNTDGIFPTSTPVQCFFNFCDDFEKRFNSIVAENDNRVQNNNSSRSNVVDEDCFRSTPTFVAPSDFQTSSSATAVVDPLTVRPLYPTKQPNVRRSIPILKLPSLPTPSKNSCTSVATSVDHHQQQTASTSASSSLQSFPKIPGYSLSLHVAGDDNSVKQQDQTLRFRKATSFNLRQPHNTIPFDASPYSMATTATSESFAKTYAKEKLVQNLKANICSLCSKSFGSLKALSRHKYVKHNGGRVLKFRCKYCDKQYSWSECLHRHIMTVHKAP